MIHRVLAFWLLMLAPALAAAALPDVPLSAQPPQWDNYRVLSERNMFLRDRARPMTSRYTPRPTVIVAPPSEDERFVLTGIIQQGDDCMAFFEDSRSGKTATVMAGDPVGRGRLTVITLDTVHYACDGDLTRITIGSSLTGASAQRTTTTAAATPPAPPAMPGVPTAGIPTALTGMPGAPPMIQMLPTRPGGMAPPGMSAVSLPATGTAPSGTTTVILNGVGTAGGMTFTVAPPPSAPPQAAGTSTDSGGGSMNILERMRLRREQELNK
jgi:hypothetical protein